MKFQFATCERDRALKFLRKLYPSRIINDTDNSAKQLLDLVEADIIRIPDPDYHGNRVAILPSKNWDEAKKDEVVAVLSKFHNAEGDEK